MKKHTKWWWLLAAIILGSAFLWGQFTYQWIPPLFNQAQQQSITAPIASEQTQVQRVSTSSPNSSILEQQCFDLIQNRVAWSMDGRNEWKPHNIKALCIGTKKPQQRVDCYQRRFAKHYNWQIAIGECVGNS